MLKRAGNSRSANVTFLPQISPRPVAAPRLAPLQPLPALAHDHVEKRTLSLTASGAIKTTPDKVDISTGVTSEAKTAREALDQNIEAMTKVVEALKDEGIDPKDIQTTNFSVNPVYDQRPYDKPQPPVVVGYRVTNQVRITLHDTKQARRHPRQGGEPRLEPDRLHRVRRGRARGAQGRGAQAGAEERHRQRQALCRGGRRRARADPLISEEESSYQPHFAPAAARMEMAKDVPIEAGTATVEVRVRVTWEIN